ncbi:unnamed protein product [Trichogramma brassicae]|uniref:Uncharacterized protein n=1 Tax=Trichogramma brassicae TaxID=86971 RepID=A0A6H5HU45_9HYME|nr:unnamed protein product [Trichogramma brassicae]
MLVESHHTGNACSIRARPTSCGARNIRVAGLSGASGTHTHTHTHTTRTFTRQAKEEEKEEARKVIEVMECEKTSHIWLRDWLHITTPAAAAASCATYPRLPSHISILSINIHAQAHTYRVCPRTRLRGWSCRRRTRPAVHLHGAAGSSSSNKAAVVVTITRSVGQKETLIEVVVCCSKSRAEKKKERKKQQQHLLDLQPNIDCRHHTTTGSAAARRPCRSLLACSSSYLPPPAYYYVYWSSIDAASTLLPKSCCRCCSRYLYTTLTNVRMYTRDKHVSSVRRIVESKQLPKNQPQQQQRCASLKSESERRLPDGRCPARRGAAHLSYPSTLGYRHEILIKAPSSAASSLYIEIGRERERKASAIYRRRAVREHPVTPRKLLSCIRDPTAEARSAPQNERKEDSSLCRRRQRRRRRRVPCLRMMRALHTYILSASCFWPFETPTRLPRDSSGFESLCAIKPAACAIQNSDFWLSHRCYIYFALDCAVVAILISSGTQRKYRELKLYTRQSKTGFRLSMGVWSPVVSITIIPSYGSVQAASLLLLLATNVNNCTQRNYNHGKDAKQKEVIASFRKDNESLTYTWTSCGGAYMYTLLYALSSLARTAAAAAAARGSFDSRLRPMCQSHAGSRDYFAFTRGHDSRAQKESDNNDPRHERPYDLLSRASSSYSWSEGKFQKKNFDSWETCGSCASSGAKRENYASTPRSSIVRNYSLNTLRVIQYTVYIERRRARQGEVIRQRWWWAIYSLGDIQQDVASSSGHDDDVPRKMVRAKRHENALTACRAWSIGRENFLLPDTT